MKNLILLFFILLPLGVAQTGTNTDISNIGISDDLKSYIHGVSRFTLGWRAICNTELKGMTEIFQDNNLEIELLSLTSGILPKDTAPNQFLNDLLMKVREHDAKYMLDYWLFDDMHTVFIVNGIKGSRIFFVHIPKWDNGEADGFCFGEWKQ